MPTTDLADRGNVLDNPGLVIDVHDRYELRVVTQRGFECIQAEAPAGIRVQPGDVEPLGLEHSEHVGNGFVFGRHRDEMPAPVLPVSRSARDREVVRFSRARGPDELLRTTAEQRGQLVRRCVDERPGASARDVV